MKRLKTKKLVTIFLVTILCMSSTISAYASYGGGVTINGWFSTEVAKCGASAEKVAGPLSVSFNPMSTTQITGARMTIVATCYALDKHTRVPEMVEITKDFELTSYTGNYYHEFPISSFNNDQYNIIGIHKYTIVFEAKFAISNTYYTASPVSFVVR